MGMRIRTNVSSLTTQRYLTQNRLDMDRSFEKLSSGFRINRSADDAAGLAVSENLRGKIRGLTQSQRNANDAVSMIQIAEGSMNEMTNILIRLRELSVQAASDTVGDREKGYLNREYTQLVDELDRIAVTTEFNGIKLFGDAQDAAIERFVVQVGPNNTMDDTISYSLEGLRFSSESLGLGKEAEIGPTEGAESPAREEIAGRLVTIDSALNKIASERATLGSVQSRLGSAITNLANQVENMQTAKSRIVDTDFAAETAELAQRRILTQSNIAVLAQANASPEMALNLLR